MISRKISNSTRMKLTKTERSSLDAPSIDDFRAMGFVTSRDDAISFIFFNCHVTHSPFTLVPGSELLK